MIAPGINGTDNDVRVDEVISTGERKWGGDGSGWHYALSSALRAASNLYQIGLGSYASPIQRSAVVDRFSVIRKPNMVTDDAARLRSAHIPETDMRMCKTPTRYVLQREPMRVLRIAIYCEEGLHHCWWPR